jgi:eukaryotic-like serine/threonine-protein kinase
MCPGRTTGFLAQRNGTGAATESQKILDHPGAVLTFPLGGLVHLGLARAYALQGETVKALAAYKISSRSGRTPAPISPS